MKIRRDRSGGTDSPQGDSRGQSAVLGMALLLGFTVVVGSTVAFAGMAIVQNGQDATQNHHAENEMATLASKIAKVGLGDSSMQKASFSSDEGKYKVVEDAGTMTVEHSEEGEIHTVTLGAIVYENGDTEVAYQGGGVFTKTGDSSSMVSPPEFHYQDETLTLPMMTVSGDSRASGSTEAVIRPESGTSTVTIYPNEEEGNPVETGTITVTVESEYYRGWEHYFDERTAEDPYYPNSGENIVSVDLETEREEDKVDIDSERGEIPLPELDPVGEFVFHGTPYDEGGNLNQLDWDLTGEYENGTEIEVVHLEGHTDKGDRYVTVSMGEWEYEYYVEDGFDGIVEIDFLMDEEMNWSGERERDSKTMEEVFKQRTSDIDTNLQVNDHRSGRHDSFDYNDGATFVDVDYDLGEDYITYLHVTENKVQVDFN